MKMEIIINRNENALLSAHPLIQTHMAPHQPMCRRRRRRTNLSAHASSTARRVSETPKRRETTRTFPLKQPRRPQKGGPALS